MAEFSDSSLQAAAAATADSIKVRTANHKELKIEKAIAMQFGTLRNFYGDEGTDKNCLMPLPNVTSDVLSKTIAYAGRLLDHKERGLQRESEEVEAFHGDLMEEDQEMMLEMIQAANYLDARELLDVLLDTVAQIIKDMTVEEVREYFGIENDFTPEEEEKLCEETKWAFK